MTHQTISTTAVADLSHHRRLGLTALALFAAAVLMILSTAIPVRADDDDDDRGINGTVMSVSSTSLRVAIKSGVRTLFIDAETRIKNGSREMSLEDIKTGDRISASVERLAENQILANKIKVKGKSSKSRIRHHTGVVIERDSRSFHLASRDGRSVKIELKDDDDDDAPEVAEVVTAIVEIDPDTGSLVANQIEHVEQIVQRLEAALSTEVDLAKAEVLKKIIDESARQHLDTLNQTLDQVQAEAHEKIEAALVKFRTDYAEVAERVGNAAPEETYNGVIAEISSSSIRVSSTTGNGSRSFQISDSTDILLTGVQNASTADLDLGQSVVISFAPVTDGSEADPTALLIEAVPPALPPIVADAIGELSEDVVQGDITVVEEQDEPGSTIIIIEEAGTGDTVGVEVTEDTVITVDGESGTTGDLEAGQQAEVTVGEDGVTADTVVVTTGSSAATQESLSGVLTAIDPSRRVIVIAPAVGEPIRLTVAADATITLDGGLVTLNELQTQDLVLNTSNYLPADGVATRLAVVRPATVQEPIEETTETPAGADPDPQEPVSGGDESSGPAPFSIRGFVKSFDGNFIVFDGITLPKSSGLTLPEGVSEGSEVDLVFAIASDGSVVLTGIQAP